MTLTTSKASIFSVLKARKFAYEIRRTDGNCADSHLNLHTFLTTAKNNVGINNNVVI
jgi:hypothetical protein